MTLRGAVGIFEQLWLSSEKECEELQDKIKRLKEQTRIDGAEIERLRVENWQLKGALGYEVPAHIPCGDFKCGLCEAKYAEIQELHRKIAAVLKILR